MGKSTTFAEFCARYAVTQREREDLAWHVAMMRARQTYEAFSGKISYFPRAAS